MPTGHRRATVTKVLINNRAVSLIGLSGNRAVNLINLEHSTLFVSSLSQIPMEAHSNTQPFLKMFDFNKTAGSINVKTLLNRFIPHEPSTAEY